MGAVRSFSPTAYIDTDDLVTGVSLGFMFYGYSVAAVGNNGSVSFHLNDISNDPSPPNSYRAWDDLGWQYCWAMPLDPTASYTALQEDAYGTPWMFWVTIAPFATDIPSSTQEFGTTQQVYYGYDYIDGKNAFLVTWDLVVPYGIANWDQSPDPDTRPRNKFQVVIYDDNTWEMNYDQIEWTSTYDWNNYAYPSALFPDATTDMRTLNHALAGYRIVPHDKYEKFTMSFTNGTGTLNVGDPIYWYTYTGEVVSIDSGNSAAGTITVRMLPYDPGDGYFREVVPPNVEWPDTASTYPNYQINPSTSDYITNNGTWTISWADVTNIYWSPMTADDHICEEFEWSRTITSMVSMDYDYLVNYTLADVVDGGAHAVSERSNCGVPGRYVGPQSLSFTPSISIDVDLSATLFTDKLEASGSLDVDIQLFAPIPAFLYGSIDIDVTTDSIPPLFGGDTPMAMGSVDVGVQLEATLSISMTFQPQGGGIGGYWNQGMMYDPAYGYSYPSGTTTTSTHSNSGSDTNCYKVTFAATAPNTSQHLTYRPYGVRSYLNDGVTFVPTPFGTTVTMSLWVYVESAGKSVKLSARTNYQNQAAVFPNYSYYVDGIVELDSATSTTVGAWEQLVVTAPASAVSNLAKYVTFYLTPTDVTTPTVVRYDDMTISFNGTPQPYAIDVMSDNSAAIQYGQALARPIVVAQDIYNYSGSFSSWFVNDQSPDGWARRLELGAPTNTADVVSSYFMYKQSYDDYFPYYLNQGSGGTRWAVELTLTAKIPSGNSDLNFGLVTNYNQYQTSPGKWVTYPTSKISKTSVKDEWVDLTIVVSGNNYHAYYDNPDTSVERQALFGPTASGNISVTPYIAAWLETGGGTFYVDSMKMRYIVDTDNFLYARSVMPWNTVANDVDFSGHLSEYDMTPSADGVINIEFDIPPALLFCDILGMEGSIDADVTVSGSWYYNKSFTDIQEFGYFGSAGAYGATSSNGYSGGSVSTVGSYGGRSNVQKYISTAANTNGSYSWLAHWLRLRQPLYAGLEYEYSIDIFVPAGKPAVTLAAIAPSEMGFLWNPPGTFGPGNIISSQTTTATGQWQRLTVTVPPTNSPYGMAIRLYCANQSVTSEFYTHSSLWRQRGILADTAWVVNEQLPSPYYPSYNIVSVSAVAGIASSTIGYASTASINQVFDPARNNNVFVFNRNAGTSKKSTNGVYWRKEVFFYQGIPTEGAGTYYAGLKIGAWVKVPYGQPRVRMSVSNLLYQSSAPNTNVYHDIAKPVYSTKWDEWEYLETTFVYFTEHNPQYWNEYSGWNSHYYAYPYIAPDGPYSPATTFYVDDFSVAPTPIEAIGTRWMPISSTGWKVADGYPANHETLDLPVDMTGTLQDITPFASGTVSVDVDLVRYTPYEVLVDSSVDVSVISCMAQSARSKFFGEKAGNWNRFGFEGSLSLGDPYNVDFLDDMWMGYDGDTDGYIWYRPGNWVPPTGGVQGSLTSVYIIHPPFYDYPAGFTNDSYFSIYTRHYAGKKLFSLRAMIWVWNTDASNPVKFRVSNSWSGWNPRYTAYNQVLGEVQTSSEGKWELLIVDIPSYLVWTSQSGNTGRQVHVDVYPSDPLQRTQYYIDNLDYAWFVDNSATLAIASA